MVLSKQRTVQVSNSINQKIVIRCLKKSSKLKIEMAKRKEFVLEFSFIVIASVPRSNMFCGFQ